MEHPTSPMRGAPPQDNHSPHSPPPDHRHRGMGDRYRPPPPPGYPNPSAYPHYPPYGGPQQNPYGPPPPHGYAPRGPGAGYAGPAPHHSSPFGYGYPTGPRGPPYHYSGGYDGGYGAPVARQTIPYRTVAPPRQGPISHPMPPTQESSSPHKVGNSTSPKSSPSRSPRDAASLLNAPNSTDHVDVERLRAAAAAELTHEEVKPIQSDFHFFAKENMAKFRELAEEEVRNSLKPDDKLDPFLVNSNLNTKLKSAWEKLKSDERDSFMVKEEEDRRRFMEEDEIASRHCATLTARGKSPARTPEKLRIEEQQERETVEETTPGQEGSLSRKIQDKRKESCEEEVDTMDESFDAQPRTDDDSPKKRVSPPATIEDDKLESPTKRSRPPAETS